VRLAVVNEGRVLIYIPDPYQALAPHGLEPSWLPVFYNPRMEFNRDLSVVILQVYVDNYAPHKPVIAVEPLAATGVRALRYALEVEGIMRVYASDIDKAAFNIMELNVALNSAWDKVSVSHADANQLIYSLKARGIPVLAVDIDPYGSPAPFLESALSILGNGGLLMVTATDTAVLEGSKSSKALRRYGVKLVKTPSSREVAVRALLGYIARVAASLDKWVKPLVSVYVDYYVRVAVQVYRGARGAQRMLEECLGYAYYYPKLGYTTLRPETVGAMGDGEITLGPLWVKDILDQEFIDRMGLELKRRYTYLRMRGKLEKLIEILSSEASIQEDIHQRLDTISSKIRRQTPPKTKIVEILKSNGFKATLTHFHPAGVRTNASLEDLIRVI